MKGRERERAWRRDAKRRREARGYSRHLAVGDAASRCRLPITGSE